MNEQNSKPVIVEVLLECCLKRRVWHNVERATDNYHSYCSTCPKCGDVKNHIMSLSIAHDPLKLNGERINGSIASLSALAAL